MEGAFQSDFVQNNAFQVAAIQKAVGGALSFAGSVLKSIFKNISGALTLQGLLQKTTSRNISGVLTLTGILGKSTGKLLSGTVTFAGSVIIKTSKIVSGGLTLIGTLITFLIEVGRRLKMRLFNRTQFNMATETKPYRNQATETREVKP